MSSKGGGITRFGFERSSDSRVENAWEECKLEVDIAFLSQLRQTRCKMMVLIMSPSELVEVNMKRNIRICRIGGGRMTGICKVLRFLFSFDS